MIVQYASLPVVPTYKLSTIRKKSLDMDPCWQSDSDTFIDCMTLPLQWRVLRGMSEWNRFVSEMFSVMDYTKPGVFCLSRWRFYLITWEIKLLSGSILGWSSVSAAIIIQNNMFSYSECFLTRTSNVSMRCGQVEATDRFVDWIGSNKKRHHGLVCKFC